MPAILRPCCEEQRTATWRANSVDPGGRRAWVELSVDLLRPTKICVGGCRSERTNPSVEMLLTVVDEVERVVAEGDDPRGC